ncbi:MAG: hypothetical protein ACXWJZ_01690 [Burkholderiaceae bacterium]
MKIGAGGALQTTMQLYPYDPNYATYEPYPYIQPQPYYGPPVIYLEPPGFFNFGLAIHDGHDGHYGHHHGGGWHHHH